MFTVGQHGNKAIGTGTGMGVAVVHGIVTSYDGGMTVESTPGHGVLLTVFLPRLHEASRLAHDRLETLPQVTQGKGLEQPQALAADIRDFCRPLR